MKLWISMDQKPHENGDYRKLNITEGSFPMQSPTIQSYGGLFDLPFEADKGFMDLLGIQDQYTPPHPSFFDLIHLPPPPTVLPPPIPSTAAPESSEVVNNSAVATPNSSASCSSNEEQNKVADGEEMEEEGENSNQDKTKKQ